MKEEPPLFFSSARPRVFVPATRQPIESHLTIGRIVNTFTFDLCVLAKATILVVRYLVLLKSLGLYRFLNIQTRSLTDPLMALGVLLCSN